MWTTVFWRRAAERAVKSAAQGLVLTLGAGKADVLTLDWQTALGGAAGMALLSICTSVASSAVGDDQDPAVVA